MLCSVIIPAYNNEHTIEKTVVSIQASGLRDYEILLVNDGSTDGTPEICDHLEQMFPSIQVIHQSNGGVSSARNRGLSAARGDYVCFFDADDSVDPDAFRESAAILEKMKPDMLLYGMRFDYYRNGNCYRHDELVCEQEGAFERTQWEGEVGSLYRCNYLTSACNKFIRREIIATHQIQFSESMHLMEDCLFSLICLDHSETIYLLPEAIYLYRQSEDEGNADRRLKRITSLTDYMKHFSAVPEQWQPIVDSIYYMLLQQKVRSSGPKEIMAIAEDHRRSTFAPQTDHDRWLDKLLNEGKFQELYLRNLKSRTRHKIAVFAKSHGLYKR